MTDRFAACLAETLKWEGGYSNDPHDPGGATMKGVTKCVYDGWREGQGLPHRDVREITQKELLAIYGKNYWSAARCGDLPAGVDLAVFDLAVNSGVGRAAQLLQKVVGADQDKHIGAVTLAAVKRADHLRVVSELMAERRAFLRRLPTFWRFGKGWMRRCDAIETFAIAHTIPQDAEGAEVLSVAIPLDRADTNAPLLDADAQSATQGRATAVVQPVADAAKSSRTIFGVLTAFGASLVGWFKDAVGQIELFEPVKQIGSGIGLNLTTVVFGITIAGLALALFARLDDAHKGRLVK